MVTTLGLPASTQEGVVRRFLDAARRGRVVDMLDAFATDAVLGDEDGREYHGIRAIATALLPYRTPARIDVEELRTGPGSVTALVRLGSGGPRAPRRFLETFCFRGLRIESLTIRPAPN